MGKISDKVHNIQVSASTSADARYTVKIMATWKDFVIKKITKIGKKHGHNVYNVTLHKRRGK